MEIAPKREFERSVNSYFFEVGRYADIERRSESVLFVILVMLAMNFIICSRVVNLRKVPYYQRDLSTSVKRQSRALLLLLRREGGGEQSRAEQPLSLSVLLLVVYNTCVHSRSPTTLSLDGQVCVHLTVLTVE